MLEALAVVAIVVYVVGRQLLGESLRGKRVILLPVILTAIGAKSLSGDVTRADIGFIVVGAVGAAVIGIGQGATLRLEHRDGGLWGRMPLGGLWWWAALVATRIALTLMAGAAGAHVAASTEPILLTLGLNRLGQAAAVTLRAHRSGIPFAPEKDGSVFMGGRDPQSPGASRRRGQS
ncbi:hypothetical protein [Streptomyces scabiei]|uniref:hypothetical protein n=1 Tax=Streptomyces scabiei TaxID=1930 RepID=UPI0007659B26|nr:hypothetical protein [Streptomyces scabiei]MDX2539330.1 hypothetical protein [Streptomyces scabiei]MDX2801018.1 hypothetical protein [Streptomyces scabiei]MDX2856246.1 hypothetical protein [Streptomyces scabiei]MDX3829561.1 hypothetical protein [Streptomyces scabiei]